MIRRPPRSTLFPYTRSSDLAVAIARSAFDRYSFDLIYARPDQTPRMWADELKQAISERSEEHTSELQSRPHLVCRLLLEKKKPGRRAVAHRTRQRPSPIRRA